jgi:pimeloyl-ACP methyl ester carboxylesterase
VSLAAVALLLVAAVVALVAAGAIYQAAGLALDRSRFPPPGRRIDIGGRALHLIESGQGPAVVFEAGISATSLSWTQVRGQVLEFARACAYDRAGLGWSDAARLARKTSAIVDDLHRLADAAQIPRPFILVGHSFGGMLAPVYAARFPQDVAGLVLVDPLGFREWLNPKPADLRMLRFGVRLSRRGAWLARIGVVRGALALLLAGGSPIPRIIAKASSGRGESVISRLVGEVRKMPPETWPMVASQWADPKSFLAMAAYLESLPVSAAEAQGVLPSENIPITVLSGSHATHAQLEEREQIAGRSPRGRHIVARKSGHWIQLDEPELVVEAIREMVDLMKLSAKPS